MNEPSRQPPICSFCSLVCELPDELHDLQKLSVFCSKRDIQSKRIAASLEGLTTDLRQADGEALSATLGRAIGLIRQAQSVLVTGRIHTVESARAAVELAQRLDGMVDPWDSDEAFDSILSMQRVGGYGVSLGEARDHSDLWIVVGDDRLLEQTPRLPHAMHRGESVPMLLIGRWSDASIQAWSEAGFDVLCIESGLEEIPKYLSQVSRLGSNYCDSQTGRWILNAKYTSILYSPSALQVECRDLWIDLLSRWVLNRNETTRVATLAWGSLQSTFHQTCTWLTGFPGRIRFQNHQPSYDPHRHRAKDWCDRQSAQDTAAEKSLIIWIDDTLDDLPTDFDASKLRRVIVGPNPPSTVSESQIWLPTGIAGTTFAANMFRGDQTILAKIPCTDPLPSFTPSAWLGRLTR
ncbi:MAG: hypothetical protein WCP62_08865 [Planctomycetota bacterium]